jgi:hypothetical protein
MYFDPWRPVPRRIRSCHDACACPACLPDPIHASTRYHASSGYGTPIGALIAPYENCRQLLKGPRLASQAGWQGRCSQSLYGSLATSPASGHDAGKFTMSRLPAPERRGVCRGRMRRCGEKRAGAPLASGQHRVALLRGLGANRT